MDVRETLVELIDDYCSYGERCNGEAVLGV